LESCLIENSMWGRFAMFVLAAVAGIQPASGHVMSNQDQQRQCRVLGAEKLPSAAGGGDALCTAVERAVAKRAPKVRYTAQIRVISRSRLAAIVIVNGRPLPEQKFAVMDRDLSSGSIERFAAALALEVSKAAEG
jgi:hypothetical protein